MARKRRRLGTDGAPLLIPGKTRFGLQPLEVVSRMGPNAFQWFRLYASAASNESPTRATVTMRAAEIAKKPLEGLDSKLEQATANADEFYQRRLPFATSQVAGELGVLAKKQGVKLTRVGYTYTPMMAGAAGALTEVRMDASLSGDYRPLVLFINGLERDKMFFLINGVTLTGQQSGTVGLRLRLTTYLRAPVGAEGSEKSVALPSTAAAEDGSR